jgi:hypothetical protein
MGSDRLFQLCVLALGLVPIVPAAFVAFVP